MRWATSRIHAPRDFQRALFEDSIHHDGVEAPHDLVELGCGRVGATKIDECCDGRVVHSSARDEAGRWVAKYRVVVVGLCFTEVEKPYCCVDDVRLHVASDDLARRRERTS